MSSSDNSSVPDELNSDYSEEGQLGMRGDLQDDDESGEYDQEMGSEEGEEEMSDDSEDEPKQTKQRDPESTVAEEINDDMVDEDNLATNIDSKRD
jgi:hypothetical protein